MRIAQVFRASYDISDKKMLNVTVDTDYGLRIEFGLDYSYEFVEGASDRLTIRKFDGIRVDENGNSREETRNQYAVRHEPFRFIQDKHFREVGEYFP